MNLFRLIRELRPLKTIKELEKVVTNNKDKIETGEIQLPTNWQAFYVKNKTWVWALIWSVGTYFSTPLVNDAITGLPVLQDIKTRTELVEKDVVSLKADVAEIKKVLTPPSQ